MDGEVSTYSTSSIREQRRYAEKRLTLQERRLAVQQRRLAALAKIDEGHEELEQAEHESRELEQAERELEALGREGTASEQPVEAEGLERVEPEMAGPLAKMPNSSNLPRPSLKSPKPSASARSTS